MRPDLRQIDALTMSAVSDRAILVVGATGNQGQEVVRSLLRSGWRVKALTRRPAQPIAKQLSSLGAEIVRGDLDNEDSLRNAIAGAYGVFSVQNFWALGYNREIVYGKNLADAALAMGVDHFVTARPAARTE